MEAKPLLRGAVAAVCIKREALLRRAEAQLPHKEAGGALEILHEAHAHPGICCVDRSSRDSLSVGCAAQSVELVKRFSRKTKKCGM